MHDIQSNKCNDKSHISTFTFKNNKIPSPFEINECKKYNNVTNLIKIKSGSSTNGET